MLLVDYPAFTLKVIHEGEDIEPYIDENNKFGL